MKKLISRNDFKYKLTLLLLTLLVFIWSGIKPYDRFTWYLEVFPVVIVIPILIFTYKKFKFTNLAYYLIFIHIIILLVGGHYTYAKVPLGDWIKDFFELSRNHYDRIGHFAQGFIPAIIVRELLLRTSPIKPGKWLKTIIVFSILGISAMYELLEWTAAEMTGTAANAFLGTQGDIWDTQKDMFLALIGAISSLIFLLDTHNKQLKEINT